MASVSESFTNTEQLLVNDKPFTTLKVDELKQELVARVLETSGLKKELQERLYKALVKETSCTDNNDDNDNTLKTCGCLCSAELEGLKLDTTILESRILSEISQGELESDIGILEVKLKEMVAVIRHQDEMIRVLNDDNLGFEKAFLGKVYYNSINRSHDNNQCNANNLNNNHFDLTNDTAPSTKQPLISRVNPSVPLVNVNSLNDLNKNDFNKNALDHTNDAALRPQQPLVPNQVSSASQINEVSTTQQKNSDNKHQKEQRKSNKDSDKNDHVSSIKSSIQD